MLQEPTIAVIPIRAVIIRDAATRVFNLQHVAHLADSLQEISQFAPVVVRQDGDDASIYHLWDGAHRLCAAIKAGLESIHAKVFPATASDDHMRRCVLECEFITRADSWTIKALKLQELKSLYEACYPHAAQGKWSRSGTSGGAPPAFVQHIVRESGTSKSTIGELLTLASKLGETVLGKLNDYQLPQQTGRELMREKTTTTQDERLAVIEKIHEMMTTRKSGRKGVPTVAAALCEMKRDERRKAGAAIKITSEDARVVRTKMEDYTGIADSSIDAVITDPLYHDDKTPLYEEAARMSARVLKPGGFAAFYCGKANFKKAMTHLDKHLTFRAMTVLEHKEWYGNVGASKLAADCKYILIYQNQGADMEFFDSVRGVLKGTGQEKDNHIFQQSVTDLDHLIDVMTKPGDLILDMFAGSGTTGVAAVLKARRTILLEEDAEDCAECQYRLSAALNQSKVMSLYPETQEFLGHFEEYPSEPAALRTAM